MFERSASLVQHLVAFEVALAQAQDELGLLPAGVATAIGGLNGAKLDAAALTQGERHAGVPVPALVAQLRALLPDRAAPWLHFGATSQDAMDTAHALARRDAHKPLAAALVGLVEGLVVLAGAHRQTPMMARTRQRAATPTSFGFVVAQWAESLARSLEAMSASAADTFELQLGGSAGVLAAFDDPVAVAEAVARRLQLSARTISWHGQRDRIASYAQHLALTGRCLAKPAQDLLLLSLEELGEISFAEGGASSTMPHKQNPVALEGVVANAARLDADAGLLAAGVSGQMQRDGRTWPLEWDVLPRMQAVCMDSAARLTESLSGLRFHPEQMLANIHARGHAALAESARFALTHTLGPEQAQRVVADALNGLDLLDALASDPRVRGSAFDAGRLASLERELRNAALFCDRSLARTRDLLGRYAAQGS